MLPTALFALQPIATLLLISCSAWIFGESCLRGHLDGHRLDGDRLERALVATVLGLGLIAQGLFVLGMLGGLTRAWTVGALLVAHLLCWRTWRAAGQALRATWPPRRPPWIATLGALIFLLPSLLLTYYPPTGFDATVYHLPYVKAFLDAGRLVFVGDLRFPVFPQVGEMGFVLAFLLEGETTAKLMEWLAWLLVAGLIVVWGRRFGGTGGNSIGLGAAALWLGTPLALWIGVQAYIDLTLTLFVTAALYAWTRWRAADRSTDQTTWIVLCGVFAGLAAGTKYLALFLVMVLGVLTLVEALRRRQARSLVILVFTVTVMMAPWYGRVLYHTGSPVFPFYAPLFGASEWTSAHDRTLLSTSTSTSVSVSESALTSTGLDAVAPVAGSQLSRMVDGLGFLLLVPWNAVFERQHFDFQAPLTPFYLLLLPLALPLMLLDRRARWIFLGLLAYGLFWLTTVRDLRFLIPAMPVLNLLVMSALLPWTERLLGGSWRSRRVAAIVAILFLLPSWGYAIHKCRERGPIPGTAEGREAYLLKEVPGYAAVQALNHERGRDYTAYALFGEHLHYHADGRLLGDWFGPGNYWTILAVLDDEAALHARLRALDVCYLLLVDGPRPVTLPRTAPTPRFEPAGSWDDVSLHRLEGCPAIDSASRSPGP